MNKNEVETNLICKIASIIDEKTVVINKGSNDGIRMHQTFLVYRIGDKILDPDTGEDLGNLEIVLGRGSVSHVQDKMATLTSCIIKEGAKKVIKNNSKLAWAGILGGDQIITEPGDILPFEDVKIGDNAKLI